MPVRWTATLRLSPPSSWEFHNSLIPFPYSLTSSSNPAVVSGHCTFDQHVEPIVTAPNRIRDFDPATHAIIGCFGQCSHSAAVNLERLEPKMTIPEPHQRLRCTKRGAKEPNIRIAYIAAGGYRHS